MRRWPSATITKSWGSQRTAERRRAQGRLPQARHEACIPTAIPATRTASTASRKSTRPTTSSRTATSAPPMTASAMPPSSTGGGGAHGFGADFGSAFSDIFEASSAWAARARPQLGPRARRRPALQHGDHAGGSLRRQDRAGAACRPRSPAKPAPARGAKAGTKPKTCPTCGGHGQVRHAQGFFTLERTCPACQGRGQVIDNPCRPARAPAASRASARCRSTFPPASRTAPASGWPAKARPACAAGRPAISTSSCRSARIRSSSATAPTCIAGCRSRW